MRICAFAESLIQAQIVPYSCTRADLFNASTPNDSSFQTVGMFSAFLFLASSFLSASTVSSSAPPSSLNQMSNSPNVPAVFEKLAMNETTALSYSPDCSISYGRNLDRASCDNALAKISQVTASVTFGERGTGNWNVVLPRRYLSGTLSANSS